MGIGQEGVLRKLGDDTSGFVPPTPTLLFTIFFPTYNDQMKIPKNASFQQSNIISCVHITYPLNPVADIRGLTGQPRPKVGRV